MVGLANRGWSFGMPATAHLTAALACSHFAASLLVTSLIEATGVLCSLLTALTALCSAPVMLLAWLRACVGILVLLQPSCVIVPVEHVVGGKVYVHIQRGRCQIAYPRACDHREFCLWLWARGAAAVVLIQVLSEFAAKLWR